MADNEKANTGNNGRPGDGQDATTKNIDLDYADKDKTNSRPGDGEVATANIDLDYVLVNELGQFGRFQLNNLLLVIVPVVMCALSAEYIFSTVAVPHRCMIPECGETAENAVYDSESFRDAFPLGASCVRYAPLGNGSLDYCPSGLFSTAIVECDMFVYQRDKNIVHDFDLGCKNWLRVLAGTFFKIGSLVALPIAGYVSDRWGRRVLISLCVFFSALSGLLRAFSVNYPMYLIMQFLHSTLGTGMFSAIYILVTELVGPKYRVITGATCSSMFAIGEVILGSVAWLVQPWRHLLLALSIPCFPIVSIYWLLTESVRWLLSKGKYDEAKRILEKAARVNKTQISDKCMQALMSPPSPVKSNQKNQPGLIKRVLSSRVLLRRVCTTPIWWVASTFVYYGLSINSTTLLTSNMYLNYMLTCAIEIPGFFTAVLLLDRIGRKFTLSGGYFLSAICNILFILIPKNLSALNVFVYLLGKFGISVVTTSVYLYTAELYPTEFRHTLLAFSSMIGRIGSIMAPLTPALMDYWLHLPSALFAALGTLGGLLVLTQPETFGAKLPDTLAEAEALGRPESKINYNI